MKIYYYLYGAYVSGVTVIPEAPNDLHSHSARWLKKNTKILTYDIFFAKLCRFDKTIPILRLEIKLLTVEHKHNINTNHRDVLPENRRLQSRQVFIPC